MPQHLQPELVRRGDQLVDVDRERTIGAYLNITSARADECECAACRLFAPQRNTAFPESFLSLLEQLGIYRTKEGEVYGCYPMPNGLRQYGGWFFLCGSLITSGEGEENQDGMSYHVRGPGNMPKPDEVFEPTPLALEFTIEVPWILLGEDPDDLYGSAISPTNGVTK